MQGRRREDHQRDLRRRPFTVDPDRMRRPQHVLVVSRPVPGVVGDVRQTSIATDAKPGVFLAKIDPAKVEVARKTVPSLQHGRRFSVADPKAGPEHLHLVRGSA